MLMIIKANHKENKMTAEKYFGPVGPPSSALPKNARFLLKHMRPRPRKADIA